MHRARLFLVLLPVLAVAASPAAAGRPTAARLREMAAALRPAAVIARLRTSGPGKWRRPIVGGGALAPRLSDSGEAVNRAVQQVNTLTHFVAGKVPDAEILTYATSVLEDAGFEVRPEGVPGDHRLVMTYADGDRTMASEITLRDKRLTVVERPLAATATGIELSRRPWPPRRAR